MREHLGDIAWSCGQFFLLAPSGQIPAGFRTARYDPGKHEDLLAKVQHLRGAVYLQDGAISRRQLTRDDRHAVEIDDRSWHAVAVDGAGEVVGCARYLLHSNRTKFQDFELRKSALAKDEEWGRRLASAVRAHVDHGRVAGFRTVEVGGWAVAPSARRSPLAARMVLLSYAVWRAIGAGVALSTATVRNHSAAILRRFGARSVEAGGEPLPQYFDPAYGCWMEVLQFDSARPEPKFRGAIDLLSRQLCSVPVICPQLAPAPVELPAMPRLPALWDAAPAMG